ncbi:MAG: pyrimidine dimer DNA glycosylase/endonuclease V [Actinomycetota bacterium]|nr:pyrimidine dimer DNA glycosylase/endonuclease V [Actinomycetota bacterium]
MWGVDPKILCNKHLLGEHLEMHMFAGCIKKKISLKGYCNNKLVRMDLLKKRHYILADEMISRGMKHNSPMPEIDYLSLKYGEIDIKANLDELISRCPACRKIFNKIYKKNSGK